MYKITALLSAVLFIPLAANAKDTIPPKKYTKKRISVEEARSRCANFSPEKRAKFAKICDKVEQISKQAQIKEKYPFISMRFGTEYFFTDYEVKEKATGAGASLVTESNFRLDLKMVQHFSPKFKTYLGLGYQDIKFENTLPKPMRNPHLNLWDFNGGVIYNPTSRFGLDLGLHYGDVFYIRPYSASELKFTKRLVPHLQLQAYYDVFSFGDLDFGVAGKLGYTPPFTSRDRDENFGNFKAKASLNYGGEIYARKQYEQWSIAGGVGVSRKQMDTNYIEGELTDVSVGLRVAIPFGWNEGK